MSEKMFSPDVYSLGTPKGEEDTTKESDTENYRKNYHGETKHMIFEDETYPAYDNHVCQVVLEVMKELEKVGKNKSKKIKKYKRLPAEAIFLFKKMEENGLDVNNTERGFLKEALKQTFELIDRKDDYDKDLIKNIGEMETLRWRGRGELRDESSFQKIVAILKDHAVSKPPLTKIGQSPRVRFAPKGEYHKKQSLS